MNSRLVISSVFALLLSSLAPGQTKLTGDANSFKRDVLQRITLLEAQARDAEASNAGDIKVARIYLEIGIMCEDVARWDQSEVALKRAIFLFRSTNESKGELPTAMTQLGSMYVAIGRLREAEKEELEALKMREALNNRLWIARSWADLAALYLAKNKFTTARDYEQKALAEFVVNGGADAFDKVSARYGLALALCSTKECPSAIPLLKNAIDEAGSALPNKFLVGFGKYLLGYAYWKSGNMEDAGPLMRQGTDAMGELLGWGHPSYVASLRHYAKYLREDKNVAAADVVESRIRQAEAIVDAHSIQANRGVFSLAGLR